MTDEQGATITSAQVQLLNLDTGLKIQTKTDTSGIYVIPYLNPGRYQIEVDASGFKAAVGSVTLTAGQSLLYNVRLTVGSTKASVSVSGDSDVTQLNT